MGDFDDFDKVYTKETKELDVLLSRLHDCDLNDWDSNFVDDMIKRISKYGNNVTVSGRQYEQLERMKRQYL